MKRFLAFFCSLFMLSAFAFADEEIDTNTDIDQENPEQEEAQPIKASENLNEAGDQYIKIGLMATCPLNFGGTFPLYKDGQMAIGGAGSLGYHRFITSWWAAGIDVYFGYHPTIGENIFTYIPIVVNTSLQPTFKKFEFPLTVGIGLAMENYLSRTYFPGLVLRGSAGAFYRATPSWSFGMELDFMCLPQWYDDSKYNDAGLFGSLLISARYHF
ncbi:MAG: hypothetical protein K5873_10685 [Treponema sp.]|nr:hypothetical protein [Treponema sp.]